MVSKDEAIHKALKVLNCLNNDRVYETAWVKSAINACEEVVDICDKCGMLNCECGKHDDL